MVFFHYLSSKSSPRVALHITLTIVLGATVLCLDLFRPYGLSLSVFYFVPALYAAWTLPGALQGICYAVLVALVFLVPLLARPETINAERMINRGYGVAAACLLAYLINQRRSMQQEIAIRAQTERALRQSEERYRLLTESQPNMVWTLRPDGTVDYVSSQWTAFTGRTMDQVAALGWQDLIYPDDLPGMLATISGPLKRGEPHQVEVRFRRHDGEFRRVLSRVVPMKDATGAVVQWIGTTTDIHDLWMAQQEQQRTNRLLQTISRVQAEFLVQSDTRNVFDQMLTALIDLTESQFGFIAEILYEADGQPYLKSRAIANITWNEETRALYEEHAVTGLEFRNLRTLFGAVITTGAPVIANDPDTDSRRGGLPPGHPPLRAFMGLPIHHSGRLLGMIGVANRVGGYDESIAQQLQPFLHTCGSLIEAVRLDRSRRQAEEALRESQHRFATVLNSIPQGVFWKDRESRYLGCNAVVARAFGYDRPEQLIGKTDHEFPGLTREQADFFIQKDREVMATGQPILGIIEQATLPNGNTIWMETNKMPLRDAQGNVIGILGTWQDITERRRLEEQLRQSQKMEAFGQLASGVAHDFNNVLTVIMGFSEMLLLGLAPDDPQRATVNAIIQAGEQAASLTRQLLSFSRKTVMAPKVVDLNDIVRDTEKMLRRLVAEHVVLALNLDPSLDRVKADPTQLGQVLMNLAVNARDAMPCGGTLTIQTANVILDERQVASLPDLKPGAYVLLKVSDTGHGMAPEVKARIFEPFFTTKSIGKGTGLGLAVVHGIIKQSGGSIHVDSEPGRGTTFNIYLPAVAERAAQSAEAVDQPPAPGTETILLVEDDDGVREFSYRALQMSGYNVIVAMDGIEALSLAERCGKDIAILVTDVVMPGLSGPELADILRSRLPNLRVLFLSGYTDDEVVRHRILHEQAGFLAKPFSPASLAAKVREELVKSSRPVPASLA